MIRKWKLRKKVWMGGFVPPGILSAMTSIVKHVLFLLVTFLPNQAELTAGKSRPFLRVRQNLRLAHSTIACVREFDQTWTLKPLEIKNPSNWDILQFVSRRLTDSEFSLKKKGIFGETVIGTADVGENSRKNHCLSGAVFAILRYFGMFCVHQDTKLQKRLLTDKNIPEVCAHHLSKIGVFKICSNAYCHLTLPILFLFRA